MEKKGFLLIIIISILSIIAILYFNVFKPSIIINNYKDYEKTVVFNKYQDGGINVCYGNKINCKKITYKTIGNVNYKKVGVYKLKYEINHKGIKKTLTKQVEVVDNEKPSLNLVYDEVKACPNGNTSDVMISAIDNYDGDITSNVQHKIIDNAIIYMVKDRAGNITKKAIPAKITDEEHPALTLEGPSTVYLTVGSKYEEPGYFASDNCDGIITDKVKVEGVVNVKKPGNYLIKYTVSDLYGNETTVVRSVNVIEKNNYTPVVPLEKTIYLTFDDGPGPYTSRLLDVLKKYNVKATFFVIGTNSKYDDLIVREHNEGHTVGLHSYTHKYSIYQNVDMYLNDLFQIHDKVQNLIGVDTRIIRFPGGSSNTISRRFAPGIMTTLTKKVEELGFIYFDWDTMSGDAGNTTDTNKIVKNVVDSLNKGGSHVILQHDIKSYSVDAVEQIIQYGLANGFSFAPLTLSSPRIHHAVNN